MADPNVLLVVLDSVRARNCSLHGHDNETTPHLSALAERERATVFEQARAPSIHSVASHASIFSGYHVPQHGVTEHESSLDPAATVWHELAADHGYETGIFSPNVIVTESSNLGTAFATLEGARRDANQRRFPGALTPADLAGDTGPVEYLRAALGHDRPLRSVLNGFHDQLATGTGMSHDPDAEHADVYVDSLLEWVDDRSGPWAACLNLMDAHYPYVPDAEHDRWAGEGIAAIHDDLMGKPLARAFLQGRPWGQLRAVESLYDGCIHQVDAAVDRLVKALESRGELDDTLVVVTSDHGEGFGERSRVSPAARLVGHSWGIHEALTHVPLVVLDPTADGSPGSRSDDGSAEDRISAPATLTRFPDAVRAALAGNSVTDAFVPGDDPVLCSTYRVVPPGDELPVESEEREPYLGPWQAVYRQDDDVDGLAKFVRHGDDAARVHVRDAQVSFRVDGPSGPSQGETADDDPAGVVEAAYDGLESADVALGDPTDRDVNADTEQRLEELGYLR